jgi:MoxR-like ATPase
MKDEEPRPADRRFGVPPSPAVLAERLRETGYLVDEGLATVSWLGVAMGRPLLLEGEPGTGKTALAGALAQALDRELIQLQCYEGIDASQALYDWPPATTPRRSTSMPPSSPSTPSDSFGPGPSCRRCGVPEPSC